MLKVVSQPVIPPRQKAPDIEITPEAERLIMKSLAKDPLQRHQTMEELFNDLQKCYGQVRYRRQLELRPAQTIPLANVKRTSASMPISSIQDEPPARRSSGSIPAVTDTSPGPAPILLTKKKERKRTLPLGLGIDESSPAPPPKAEAPRDAPPTGEMWLDEGEDEPTDEAPEWSDIDIDAPAGTRG
jgi:hypothetical protein